MAPYGPVGWVKNVPAGGVRLRRGSDDSAVTPDEVGGEEADRVVAAYHQRESFARPYMDVPENPTVGDFAARADQFRSFGSPGPRRPRLGGWRVLTSQTAC